jgi:hypothetical protein
MDAIWLSPAHVSRPWHWSRALAYIARASNLTLGLFILFLAVTAGISSADAYLNLKYPVTSAVEENPIARWILLRSHNDVALLISLKLFGTSLVIGLLCLGYWLNKRAALIIAGAIATVQVVILLHIIGVIP